MTATQLFYGYEVKESYDFINDPQTYNYLVDFDERRTGEWIPISQLMPLLRTLDPSKVPNFVETVYQKIQEATSNRLARRIYWSKIADSCRCTSEECKEAYNEVNMAIERRINAKGYFKGTDFAKRYFHHYMRGYDQNEVSKIINRTVCWCQSVHSILFPTSTQEVDILTCLRRSEMN